MVKDTITNERVPLSYTTIEEALEDGVEVQVDCRLFAAQAKKIMQRNNIGNRTLRRSRHMQHYELNLRRNALLQGGKFAISFLKTSELADGQHRLDVISKATDVEMGVPVTLTFNEPTEAKLHHDSGRNRNQGDVAEMFGIEKKQISFARNVMNLSNSYLTSQASKSYRHSNLETHEWLGENRLILQQCFDASAKELLYGRSQGSLRGMKRHVVGAFMFLLVELFGEQYAKEALLEQANQFFQIILNPSKYTGDLLDASGEIAFLRYHYYLRDYDPQTHGSYSHKAGMLELIQSLDLFIQWKTGRWFKLHKKRFVCGKPSSYRFNKLELCFNPLD
jgi:hypothetical protein